MSLSFLFGFSFTASTSIAVIMTVFILGALGAFAYTMRSRMLVLLKMRHEPSRFEDLPQRLLGLAKFGLGQKRLMNPEEFLPGLAHATIFFAFTVLSIRTLTLFGMAYGGFDFHFPLLGDDSVLGIVYLTLKDIFVLLALFASLYFLYLRLFNTPERMKKSGEAVLILCFIAGLMITEILFDAGHQNIISGKELHWYHPAAGIGVTFFKLFGLGKDSTFTYLFTYGSYWIHCAIILIFLNLLPIGKHFHVITGLPTVFLKRLTPDGQLPKDAILDQAGFYELDVDMEQSLEKLEEVGEDAFMKIGMSNISQLPWKMAVDTYSCTECGRCMTHCPTAVTGKPLTHRGVNLDIRSHIMDTANDLIGGKDEEEIATIDTILSQDTVWACTTCGWCETACPVFIENIPRLIDIRRADVNVRAEFPVEAQGVFENLEYQSNPWGIGSHKRADWTKGLDIPTVAENPNFEYLWYVGCAGAFDDRQQKVAKALYKVLKAANINFAILGEEESCNGDTARRLGNEMLFTTLAKMTISSFQEHGVKKIFTQCPHCFNVFKNEYVQFGVEFEVLHHTELISTLLADKRIKLDKSFEQLVTYHDSCYMGRYNDVYNEPRNILKSIPNLRMQEMKRTKRESFCCGAGGGRMWLEEHIGERINQNRIKEAVETQAEVVVSNCPFCLTMFKDGLNEVGVDNVEARDIVEIVADCMDAPADAEA